MIKYCKAIALVIVLTMVLGVLGGCATTTTTHAASTPQAADNTAVTSPAAATDSTTTAASTSGKHVLNIAKLIELQAVDPDKVNDGMSNEVLTAVFDGLYSLDAKGELQPLMAESYDKSADGLTYTFHLRKANWSNGDPVTANDFVFSWRRLVTHSTAAPNSNEAVAAGILNANEIVNGSMDPSKLGVTAKDDNTLVVQLAAPVPYFLRTLIRPAFLPIDQKYYSTVGVRYGMNPATTIYNGPFVWTSWDYATNFSVEKNPNYWNAANISIDEINWKVVKDVQTAALLFEDGKVDWTEISGDLIDKYANDARFTKALEVHMWYFIPNFATKALADTNIRTALATSFDKDAIANQVMNNGAQAANYFVGYKLAVGPDGKQFRDSSDTYLKYDVASAQTAWQAGLKDLGVTTLTLNLLYWDDPASIGQAEFVASEWEKNLPGLTVNLTSMPKAAANTQAANGKFDIYLFRWGPDYPDPMAFLELLSSTNVHDYGQYKNAAYDAIIAAARTPAMENDISARWDSLKKAEQIILGEAGIFPTVQNGLGMLVNPKVHGMEVRNVGVTWNYRIVTMDN